MAPVCFVPVVPSTTSSTFLPTAPPLVCHQAPRSAVRTVPACTARSSRKPKRKTPPSKRARPSSNSSSKGKSFDVSDDPLLNDNDIDTTDITTFVSCPVCFNSLMIRPEHLVHKPLMVNCNCCGKSTLVSLDMLEDLDGEFDHKKWLIEYNAQHMSEEDIEGLQQFATPSS